MGEEGPGEGSLMGALCTGFTLVVIIGSWFIFPIWVPFPFPFQWYPSDLFCLFLAPFTVHNRWVFLGIPNTTIVQISHAHFVESIC
jgi:hypothetical protein